MGKVLGGQRRDQFPGPLVLDLILCEVCEKLTSGPPDINFIVAYMQISLLNSSTSFAINKC